MQSGQSTQTDPAYVESGLTRVVLDHAADNVVRGNRFVDVTYGVRVEDDGTVVEGNTFESSTPGKHAVVEIETQDGRTIEPRAVQVYPPFVICDLGEPEPEILALRETDIRRVRI